MLSVVEALRLISESVRSLKTVPLPLSEALGSTLAADVISGLDSPPFDKALMDGYAVRSEDCRVAGTVLEVVDEVTAGRVATKRIAAGQAIRIMTGAPLPDGADAVVQVELTSLQGEKVQVQPIVTTETNILRQGSSIRKGRRVLQSGRTLRPQEVGLLAELGCHTVIARGRPRVAILATGDELVPIAEEPGPGQIRNSNESMLAAQVERAGGIPVPLGIARDDAEHLAVGIALGLQADMLLLSGGVSAGKLDLVPAELERAGVAQVFHKVRVKPGKPVWFGTRENQDGVVPVFGLPGNPVSSMVCFELFVRAAMRELTQAMEPTPRMFVPLSHAVQPTATRPTYHPATLVTETGRTLVRTIDWAGSADLRCTVDADGMALLPMGDHAIDAGTLVEYVPW